MNCGFSSKNCRYPLLHFLNLAGLSDLKLGIKICQEHNVQMTENGEDNRLNINFLKNNFKSETDGAKISHFRLHDIDYHLDRIDYGELFLLNQAWKRWNTEYYMESQRLNVNMLFYFTKPLHYHFSLQLKVILISNLTELLKEYDKNFLQHLYIKEWFSCISSTTERHILSKLNITVFYDASNFDTRSSKGNFPYGLRNLLHGALYLVICLSLP